MSASKAFNLAGLKAAMAVPGPDGGADLARIPEEVSHGASHVGVIAHRAAYLEGGAWLDALLAGLEENRRLLASLLAEQLPERGLPRAARGRSSPGWTSAASDWGPTRPRSCASGRGWRCTRDRVSVSGGEGHARLNFGTSPEILREAVQRIAAAL